MEKLGKTGRQVLPTGSAASLKYGEIIFYFPVFVTLARKSQQQSERNGQGPAIPR
jgi:hypothetical protein